MENIKKIIGAERVAFNFSVLIIAFSAISYMIVALRSWFFQDDFGFLLRYQTIGIGDLMPNESNFGRPLSRSIYWWGLGKLFGPDAPAYYCINIFILLLNANVLAGWLRKVGFGRVGAVAAAAIYISMLPAIINITWLSNSQHLLAHTFIFLLLHLTTYPKEKTRFGGMCVWIMVFIAGIASNIYVVASLGAIFIFWMAESHLNVNKIPVFERVFLLLAAIIAVLWGFKVRSIFSGQYTNQYDMGKFFSNLKYYFFALNAPLILGPAAAGIFYGVIVRRRITLVFLSLALVFYLPFAFAKDQRYENYTAVAYLFFLLSVLAGLENGLKGAVNNNSAIRIIFSSALMTIIVGLCYYQGHQLRQFFSLHPRGAAEYELVKFVANTVVGSKNSICFHVDVEKESAWWLFLGGGQAFNFYTPVDGLGRKYLLATEPGCMVDESTHFRIYFEDWRSVAIKIN